MPATTAYISENASRRAIPVEFSSAGHLRPRDMCTWVYTYTWRMHAACRRYFSKRCVARTFLYVWAYVRVCDVPLYERRSIVICLGHPVSRGALRLHACVCARCGRVATRYRASIVFPALSLARAHINTCSPRATGWLLGSWCASPVVTEINCSFVYASCLIAAGKCCFNSRAFGEPRHSSFPNAFDEGSN